METISMVVINGNCQRKFFKEDPKNEALSGHVLAVILYTLSFLSFTSSLASSVEWQTQLRALFPPGCKNTLIMKMVQKEEGLNREEIKTASSHHHRSLPMGMKKDLLLMGVTPQSQAPVTQVNKSVGVSCNQKCTNWSPIYIYIPGLL